MMTPRISLFAEHERADRRTKIGDPLVGLTKHVDFEALAAGIDAAAPRPSRAKGGRPPYPTVLMVKILVRCMGIVRVTFVLHLKVASYNLKRLVFLKEGGLAAF